MFYLSFLLAGLTNCWFRATNNLLLWAKYALRDTGLVAPQDFASRRGLLACYLSFEPVKFFVTHSGYGIRAEGLFAW